MGNITNFLVIVLAINVFMFLAQSALIDANPSISNPIGYTCEKSILGAYDKNNCKNSTNYILNAQNLTSDNLPPTSFQSNNFVSVASELVSDIYNTVKGWLFENAVSMFIREMATSPYTILSLTGMPSVFVFTIGTFWHLLGIFLIVSWLKGGDA